ncbi:hypothetical protein LOAG_10763 [Loa loa]|uniref:Uncharacterized protein n=1 Tax=Loa loa TaxID=7209 RepID=A0A1S0TP98_LOALO|nr:hypothetical protein LOAG_10763 [Loa loa]EFO17735.2 hypothetical protein LOAG_10763 [Loa loa]
MFVVPNCQPATELYGLLEAKLYTTAESPEASRTLEKRLQLLGIKNSIIQENLGVKTRFEANNRNKRITLVADSFESIDFAQKLGKEEVKGSKCSARLWLWHQYLSRHGNCSLCERPLNGLHEVKEFQTLDVK